MSWKKKLDGKLAALSDTTSSAEALAKWMGFNRKHSPAFAGALLEALNQATPNGQTLILSVVHEVLILEKENEEKWNKLADLRAALGESVILPFLQATESPSDAPWAESLLSNCKEWDSCNSFGGPTLIHQMRKLLSPSSVTAASPKDDGKPASQKKESGKKEPDETVQLASPDDLLLGKIPEKGKKPERASSITETTAAAAYDFEATGIAAQDIAPSAFVGPCGNMAKLEISRDIPNDLTVQLASLLSALPPEVRAECAKAAEQGDDYPGLDEDKAQAFSEKMNDALIDIDLESQFDNIAQFQRIVSSQTKERQVLIDLLIQSRCKFGAEQAAKAFYEAELLQEVLKKRKQIVMDAMELEGLDVDDEDKDVGTEPDLAPFSWYKPDGETAGEASKKARVE